MNLLTNAQVPQGLKIEAIAIHLQQIYFAVAKDPSNYILFVVSALTGQVVNQIPHPYPISDIISMGLKDHSDTDSVILAIVAN